jgi:site-specific recombinase XerC
MRARNLSWRTLEAYSDSVKRMVDHAREHDHDPFGRRAVEEYLATVADTRAPATVSFRYRARQQWFKWLIDEDELNANPMAKMKAPQVPEHPVPVLTADQMRTLFATCEKGKEFVDRRDIAIMRMFADTGMRLGEMAGLLLDDLDLDVDQVAYVTGKGRRQRACPFGNKTAQALDRYLRMRARHKRADDPQRTRTGRR